MSTNHNAHDLGVLSCYQNEVPFLYSKGDSARTTNITNVSEIPADLSSFDEMWQHFNMGRDGKCIGIKNAMCATLSFKF